MTPQEQSIWTPYLNKVKEFLKVTDLSKLADEDALQEAFCEYMNAKYKETIREVRIPALGQIEGIDKDYWEIDESTKHDPHEYIPCELKFHGIDMADRDFVGEVHTDAIKIIRIVRQFSDVHVGACVFSTIDKDEARACEDLGDVESFNLKCGNTMFYVIIARFTKADCGGQKFFKPIFPKLYATYYNMKKSFRK